MVSNRPTYTYSLITKISTWLLFSYRSTLCGRRSGGLTESATLFGLKAVGLGRTASIQGLRIPGHLSVSFKSVSLAFSWGRSHLLAHLIDLPRIQWDKEDVALKPRTAIAQMLQGMWLKLRRGWRVRPSNWMPSLTLQIYPFWEPGPGTCLSVTPDVFGDNNESFPRGRSWSINEMTQAWLIHYLSSYILESSSSLLNTRSSLFCTSGGAARCPVLPSRSQLLSLWLRFKALHLLLLLFDEFATSKATLFICSLQFCYHHTEDVMTPRQYSCPLGV